MKIFLSILTTLVAFCSYGDIPTISMGAINGSSTLSSPTFYPVTNPLFSFPGTRVAETNFSGKTYAYSIGDTDPQGVMMPMKVAFNIDAQEFEVLCFGGYPYVMVYNPPNYTPITNALVSSMGQGYTWVRVQFSSKASRNIIFYLSGSQGNFIGGVNVQSGDTITTNTLGPRKTLEVLGDSYTEGYSQSDLNSRWLGGFAMQLERMFTNVDVISDGVGGTGYSWPGAAGAGTVNYLGRFWTDVVSNNPNYLLITGGLNDTAAGVPTNTFYNAVTNLFALSLANLPNTKIAVVGSWYAATYYAPFVPPSSNQLLYDALIGQAATNYGIPFIDAMREGWLNENNYSFYMGSDNIHPTIAGYTVIASNIMANLPSTFSALPVTSDIYNLYADGESYSTNQASATYTASPTSGALPLAVNFTYTGTNGTSFAWTFGDGGTSTSQNPAHSYTSAGNFSVKLVVNGTTANTEANLITVTNSSAQSSATFTASTTTGAAPLGINFTYTGTNGSSFAWSFGDGGTSTSQNPGHTYNSAGIYSVTLVVNGSTTNSESNLITVTNSSVQASAAFTATPTTGAASSPVNFYYTGTNGSLFEWTFGDGGSSTSQNPAHTYSSAGTYSVSLVVDANVTNTQPNLITITNNASGAGPAGISLNVTNYGAIGDATNCLVNCTSNSDVVTFPSAVPARYLGEQIILFNAGWAQYGTLSSGSSGVGWQDQVATITNISGTSVYMNLPASNTLTGTYCVIGHNNVASFLACNAKCGPGTNLYIPGLPNSITGVYLSIPTNSSGPYGDYCLLITNCGYTIYGDGSNIYNANGPDLMASGAWQFKYFGNVGTAAARGMYFDEWPPIGNNNLPLTIQNLTVDGGVQQGNTQYHGEYINQVDGGGWDTSHDAWLAWSSASLANIKNLVFNNVKVQHWRGEMLKSIDEPPSGGFTCENSTFYDGDATAVNFYPSSTYTNCLFNDTFQWFEIYQQHTTGPDNFINCVVTNISYNLAAVNGGAPFGPTLTVSGCTIWPWDQANGGGVNGFQLLPADNVIIESNNVTCPSAYGQSSFVIQTITGWQGTGPTSNILVYANSVTNCSELFQAGGGSGVYSAVDTMINSNIIVSASDYNGILYLMYDYGTTTNYSLFGNDCSRLINSSVLTFSGVGGSPFAMVGTNNIYWTRVSTTANAANALDYVNGSRFCISGPFTGTSTKYALTTTDGSQIPSGAEILITNGNSSSASVP
ncbi:MAG: PKD domain-containing protein, partial [Verrucomicrobiota bacterium]